MSTPVDPNAPTPWIVNDPRMWRDQCRVGDVAFQHLFCTSKGKPLPDWVKDGLPKMYHLLSALQRTEAKLRTAREALVRISTDGSSSEHRIARETLNQLGNE